MIKLLLGQALILCFLLIHPTISYSQASCNTATTLAVRGANFTTAGNLYNANATNISAVSFCGGNYADVWYKFQVPANSNSVTINVVPTGTTSLTTANTFIQLFNTGTCTPAAANTMGCQNIGAPRNFTGLTAGNTYLFRIYVTTAPTTGTTAWQFNVSVIGNDDCANAVNLIPGSDPLQTGTVFNASLANGATAACASSTADDDVWYKFTATASRALIALSSIGADLETDGARIQLFSGTCGSFTSLQCSNGNVLNATGLTVGSTYYVRVYSVGSTQTGFREAESDFSISLYYPTTVRVGSGRMQEIYDQTILSAPRVLADPWEVTYGPDDHLWITESKGYKVYRMDPNTGERTTVLDLTQTSTFLPTAQRTSFNAQFDINVNGAQGGMAGFALHPKFLHPTSPENYAYVAYIRHYNGGSSPTGIFFKNSIVQFQYDIATQKFVNPIMICDTLPGGNDHNSQRMIIAPVGGVDYLFYASGDVGAGQFDNRDRPNKAQLTGSYEGKILRFNLMPSAGTHPWIPTTNPYGANSAVYAIGVRNNQGFAFDTATNILYGSSHGPYSDDEINIIQSQKNYGHPLVIGYANDDNYNGITAGAAKASNNGVSSCPTIVDESNNAASIGAAYKDPLFSAYPNSVAYPSISALWNTLPTPNNGGWPSEGWSGLDLYTHTLIPGWKQSLVAASLKWGRLVRLKLNTTGDTVVNTGGYDTVSYFGSVNRFRDIAFAPNGKDIYVVMDRSTSTSGPSAAFPVVPACQGCVQKYTFLGYADAAGKSSMPTAIPVTAGVANSCNTGTTLTIDAKNNNLWVPITGPDGNVLAEIFANGNNLGTVTSSFYTHSGAIRTSRSVRYLDRNITITPQNQPSTPVKIRLYLSKAEYDALDVDPGSGVSAITDLRILKNNDACGSAVASPTTAITPTFAEVRGTATNGYVLQGDISSFSSFYFASSNFTLPMELLTFTGSLQNAGTLLRWTTENETNASHFVVERSLDGVQFESIGQVKAKGNSTNRTNYLSTDAEVYSLNTPTVYYRLKMVDKNNEFKYSNVITISVSDMNSIVTVSPNPVTNIAQVRINPEANGYVKWTLVDNAGRAIQYNQIYVQKNSINTFSINMESLAQGAYYLQLSGAGMDKKVKLQKL
jgi:PQQ-dependent dehydrogenase (s-GDH family)